MVLDNAKVVRPLDRVAELLDKMKAGFGRLRQARET